jgi:hypothetical protein
MDARGMVEGLVVAIMFTLICYIWRHFQMKIFEIENSLHAEIEEQGLAIQTELQNVFQNFQNMGEQMNLDPFDILELKRQEMMTGIFGHLAQFVGRKFGMNMGVYTAEEIPEKTNLDEIDI